MTMLMHTRGPFERVRYSSDRQDTIGARPENAHLAMIRRFFLCAVIALLAGTAVAGIMAIKVAAVFWRLHYT